jgi:hypothetical protein
MTDASMKLNPSLASFVEEIPHFECPDVQAGAEEKANLSKYQLLVSVRIFPSRANSAQSSMHQNGTSGALSAKYRPQKM